MSEYQYYEFLALDRPLDDRQHAEVRSLSTRAAITATSFVNEYHWGNFRGDPNRMMERYYDAHLYLTNWGTHRIMLRLPRELLDIAVAEDHCVGDQVTVWTTGKFLMLDMTSEDDSSDWEYDPHGRLSAIVGARTELATGDLRSLYLAWLAGYGAWERDEDSFDRDEDHELEPPVPPGLTTLTAAQQALAEFLRLDDDLLAIAAQASPPLEEIADDPGQLAAWVTNLPHAEKNRLLLRVVDDHAVTVRLEMLRRFRDEHTTNIPNPPRRTVADLLDGAARRRTDRQRQATARRADQEARHEKARALAREQRLDELARTEDAAWSRVDAMIATRKPAEYDAAITLLTDLHALAERDGRRHTFTQRSMALRQTHTRKPSLIERLNRAGI
ncbi:MAG TPA: hypothetical protein VFW64_12015 [Pseudonocardiaceae bacterium]|nr:hypothetical protein [Pseudonocardiaceae bacterium]